MSLTCARGCLTLDHQAFVENTTRFPQGPVGLPTDFSPFLTSAWFMHFRLGMDKPFEEKPRRRLIIRQHLLFGDVDLVCWGLYSEVRDRAGQIMPTLAGFRRL